MIKKSHKRSAESVILRLEVVNGRAGLFAADDFSKASMKRRGFRVGNELTAVLKKPRDVLQHRTMHALGQLFADNIDQFHGLDAHQVLKRLQWEANIGCEEMGVEVPGVGYAMIRIPMSLSFESMDGGVFTKICRQFCDHVSANYWPDMEPSQIEEMGLLMDRVA